MNGHVIGRGIVVAMVAVVGGCSAKERQRITLLEQTNRNLTDRLNRASSDLEALGGERSELGGRLTTALAEMDALREELAERPIPSEAAPGWTDVPGGAMIAIEGSVLFAPGMAALRDQSRRALDGIVSTVQGDYADRDILVFGHTDDQRIAKSGWTDNYQLSTERALAVVRYLRDRGVSPVRLIACGCGEHRQRVPNTSDANRVANRRVEILAVEAGLLTARP